MAAPTAVNIDPKDTIAGQPIVAVRDALRRLRDSWFNVADLAERLDVGAEAAARVHAELVTRGWVERVDGDSFEVTGPAGMAFKSASARRPFQRKVAEARLLEWATTLTASQLERRSRTDRIEPL